MKRKLKLLLAMLTMFLLFSACFGPKPQDVCSDPQVKNQIIDDWKKKYEFPVYLMACDSEGLLPSLNIFSFGSFKVENVNDLEKLSKKFPKISPIALCVKEQYKKKYFDCELKVISAGKNQAGNFVCEAKFDFISHHPADKNNPVFNLGNIKYYVDKSGKKLIDYSFTKTTEFMDGIDAYKEFIK